MYMMNIYYPVKLFYSFLNFTNINTFGRPLHENMHNIHKHLPALYEYICAYQKS